MQATLDLAGPLTPSTVGALVDVCESAEDTDPGTLLQLRLLSGTGAVPGDWPGRPDVHLVGKWEKALRRLERLDRFTVAVLDGPCGQAVLDVMLVTDYRIAAVGTTVSPASRADGAWPGMALYRLALQVGHAAARRLVLLPGEMAAERLLDVGLLDEVTDDPDAVVTALWQRAARPGGSEPAIRRSLLLEATTVPFENALGTHLAACDRSLRAAVPQGEK
ncbi:enoyl-CoA-hydratase DpgB [Streptomyces fuscichromogenes]|nr:enoyl-CoA-hydratase DpgB [Streptomyces fuscichromogenes]